MVTFIRWFSSPKSSAIRSTGMRDALSEVNLFITVPTPRKIFKQHGTMNFSFFFYLGL